MQKKNRRNVILLGLLLFTVFFTVIGGSYAFFSVIFQDTRNNETSSFTTGNLSNATIVSNIPNGVGAFLSTDIYPGHKEVLGLSVTGSGEANSKSYFQFKYKVSENGLGSNVKVSVYRSGTPIGIQENHFNCVKKNEKIENSNDTKYFETCEEKDLGLLLEETVLTGGAEDIVIGKDTITIKNENEDVTKYYYVVVEFLNKEETQNELMNRSFAGKVEVELATPFERDYTNKIEGIATTKNESYQKQETFSIHVTSEKYRLVSMSEDNKSWEELEEKSKDITIEKTVTENGTYNYYFQDEAENIKEVSVTATKIDNKKPISNMSVTKTNNVVGIDASTSKDNETRIVKYYYSKDGTNYEESTDSTYEFTENFEYGIATTMLTNYERNQIKKVYLRVEDEVGNISDVKEFDITETDFSYDETKDNNLRYIGVNPNNYVSFNNELWQIIGVMNNIDNGNGKKETRIKIRSEKSIGTYSWDSSSSDINNGGGINEWSEADLMKLLNPGYESESVGGSLYWNRKSGKCYNDSNNTTTDCDFSTNGLTSLAKEFIDNAIWNTGSCDGVEYIYNNINTFNFYNFERSTNTGKICTSGLWCNDDVPRTFSWKGMIGLVYPSDYGFSTKGSKNVSRSTCLNTPIFLWNTDEYKDCSTNSWYSIEGTSRWTMTPYSNIEANTTIFGMSPDGRIGGRCYGMESREVYPVLYLKSNIKIISGVGSEQQPFVLSKD